DAPVEGAPDGGERDADDGRIEKGDAGAEDGGRQDPVTPPAREGERLGGRARGRWVGGGSGEREVEVVDERGIPSLLDVLLVEHLGEDQGGLGTGARGARRRSAPVEVPVPQREGDDVTEPDGGAAGQQ